MKLADVGQDQGRDADATRDAVIALLDAGLPDRTIVRRLGVSRRYVIAIRTGRSYLRDPAFQEENDGPPVVDHGGHPTGSRDPSPDQIRRRCKAIRRVVPRQPVGQQKRRWTAPIVQAPEQSGLWRVG